MMRSGEVVGLSERLADAERQSLLDKRTPPPARFGERLARVSPSFAPMVSS